MNVFFKALELNQSESFNKLLSLLLTKTCLNQSGPLLKNIINIWSSLDREPPAILIFLLSTELKIISILFYSILVGHN